MSIDEKPGEAARASGAFAVVIGLLIAAFGFLTDHVPTRGYYFAGLLVLAGSAVRIEAALKHRTDPVRVEQQP
ncbi:hypothetical protein AB0F72_31335 [Actinoplanes sp. NPDC023936]|uniref:hypothetical protein n=1 Tax=Actinoplanes sp. NPDC023936 TaxID=3154910 RepID=UPI0033CB67A1